MLRNYLESIQELKHRWQDTYKDEKRTHNRTGRHKERIEENGERDTARKCRNEIRKAKTHLFLGFGLYW